MTNKEAAEYLSNEISIPSRNIGKTKYLEAINLAVTALNEKAIGYWRTPEKGESIGWICTNCENDIAVPTPYCPYCGARMNSSN